VIGFSRVPLSAAGVFAPYPGDHSILHPAGPQASNIEWLYWVIFWIVFVLLGLIADFVLPLWWALAATIPVAIVSWWVAYRSEWF